MQIDWKEVRKYELRQGGFVLYQGPACACCRLPTPDGKNAMGDDSGLIFCVVCSGDEPEDGGRC